MSSIDLSIVNGILRIYSRGELISRNYFVPYSRSDISLENKAKDIANKVLRSTDEIHNLLNTLRSRGEIL